jgi:GGDEF domain-containing protein
LLGILFGLVAGVVTVFIIEFVNIQLIGNHSVQFVDRQTGKYTRSYFDHRLTQEISRSSRNKYNYSLALIRLLDHSAEEESKPAQISNEKFDMMYDLLRTSFREEDVIAQYDLDTIGLLIPDLVGDDTKNRIESIINEQYSDSENETNDLYNNNYAVGIVFVENHYKGKDELLRLLSQAVFLASEEESDGIYLRTDKDNSRTTPGR